MIRSALPMPRAQHGRSTTRPPAQRAQKRTEQHAISTSTSTSMALLPYHPTTSPSIRCAERDRHGIWPIRWHGVRDREVWDRAFCVFSFGFGVLRACRGLDFLCAREGRGMAARRPLGWVERGRAGDPYGKVNANAGDRDTGGREMLL